jgi:hypothetical protein
MYQKMEIEQYLKKIETAEPLYCDLHDAIYFDFEGGCPSCIEERLDFKESINHKVFALQDIEDLEGTNEASNYTTEPHSK